MEGRLGRFYEDNCLLDQKFVMEEKLSVQVQRLFSSFENVRTCETDAYSRELSTGLRCLK